MQINQSLEHGYQKIVIARYNLSSLLKKQITSNFPLQIKALRFF